MMLDRYRLIAQYRQAYAREWEQVEQARLEEAAFMATLDFTPDEMSAFQARVSGVDARIKQLFSR